MDYYVLFDADSYIYDEISIPNILLITPNLDDVLQYLLDAGYDEDEIADYGDVVSFVNENSEELEMWLVHHYNR